MALNTEQGMEKTVPADAAEFPPQVGKDCGPRLFQTIDELSARHGNATGTKHRMMQAAVALIGGSLLFAALYALILLLE